MSAREFTCVVCPNGCSIVVEVDDDETPVVAKVRGNVCKRGEEWARQEVENPLRTIASSVSVSGGDFPLASVRTTRPIPLGKIRDVMETIRQVTLAAPVEIGDVVLVSPAGCDTEVIATRGVGSASRDVRRAAKAKGGMKE
ncbi:MAG TPA: molybdopterin oxidoreductase [Synergistaceae bacterium]|jgi:CxxC motif-containing protein|nr:molybdopterin oxidoreductase [Synergistaceae bacterium]